MATVYVAHDAAEATVAVKVLSRDAAGDATQVAQFEAEARLLHRFDSPNTVRFIESGTTADQAPYYVMEFLHGVTLDQLALNQGGRMNVDEALVIADAALGAFEHFHELGVVHRDIKPANIVVTRLGEVKVIDFGAARVEGEPDPALTRNTRLGTPAYMSPEQALNAAAGVDPRSDIFSLGATLFRVLSGRKFRDVDSSDEAFVLAATTPPVSLARAAPDMPLSVIRLVDRSVAWNPADRYQDAASMREAIREILRAGATARESTTSDAQSRHKQMLQSLGRIVAREEGSLDPDAQKEKLREIKEFFRHCSSVFGCAKQYDWKHDQTVDRRRKAFAALEQSLARYTEGLAWTLRPYSFDYLDETVWEPTSGTDDIPYNLFSSGFRIVRVLPGLTFEEFESFLELMQTDPVKALPPEDDLSTVFIERRYKHVEAELVTSFDVSLLQDHLDVQDELAQLRKEIEGQLDADFAERADVAGMLAAVGDGGLKETDAVALDFQKSAAEQLAAPPDTTFSGPVAAEMHQRLVGEASAWDDRTYAVLARAFRDAVGRGDRALLADPLRELVGEYIEAANGAALARLVLDGGLELDDPDSRSEWFRCLLDRTSLPPFLREVTAREYSTADALAPLVEVLDAMPGTVFQPLFQAYLATFGEPVAAHIRAYLSRHLNHNEKFVGEALATAAAELAQDLILLLCEKPGPGANAALQKAARNRSLKIRLRALSQTIADPNEATLTELNNLLRCDDAEVRTHAIALVRDRRQSVAAPKLLAILREPEVHSRALLERQQLLATVFEIAPGEAEILCREMVQTHGFLPDARLEPSRKLAAEMLGTYAQSEEALAALASASSFWWWNSAELKESARAAIQAIQSRRGGA